ncbi:MAG: hypothetical protein WCQ99_12200 [Pseudomonadota bacterium]
MLHRIETPPGARIDTLSGNFIIFQPESGQRYTTDDILAAWLSVQTFKEFYPHEKSFLDLGSGLCSVPMILLWAFPDLKGVGIEIRGRRLFLGAKSNAANGLTPRFDLIQGDIRQVRLRKKFPAVTSSPPYYEKHEGPISSNSDKAAVRFELHGAIEDYCSAASDHLEEGGFFTTVYPYRYAARVFAAAKKNDLHLKRRIDIVPKQTKAPHISLFTFCKGIRCSTRMETLTVRNQEQSFTDAFRKIRAELGFPDRTG